MRLWVPLSVFHKCLPTRLQWQGQVIDGRSQDLLSQLEFCIVDSIIKIIFIYHQLNNNFSPQLLTTIDIMR